MKNIIDITLDESGINLLKIPLDTNSITVFFLVNTGSRYENKQAEGIAHFFEHMVFKGTHKYKTQKELFERLDTIGAKYNAFTSHEYTGFYIKTIPKHIHLALDILSDMLFMPLLRQEDIDKEKHVIVEEYNMYKDSPSGRIKDMFYFHFFKRPLGHKIIGTKSNILSFTSKDFKKFLDAWYHPENMIIAIAGDKNVLLEDNIDEIVSLYIKKYARDKQFKKDINNFLLDDPYRDEYFSFEKRDIEQTKFIVAWPSFNIKDKRKTALNLLSLIFGGYSSSKLFQELREKRGLCYYVYSNEIYFRDGGALSVEAGVNPSSVTTSLEVIMNEAKKLKQGNFGQKELDMAKDNMIGTWILSMENSSFVANYYAFKKMFENELPTIKDMEQRIQAISLDEVKEIANLVFSQKPKLVLLGPESFKEQEIKDILNNVI